jgi:hypothetical protein
MERTLEKEEQEESSVSVLSEDLRLRLGTILEISSSSSWRTALRGLPNSQSGEMEKTKCLSRGEREKEGGGITWAGYVPGRAAGRGACPEGRDSPSS